MLVKLPVVMSVPLASGKVTVRLAVRGRLQHIGKAAVCQVVVASAVNTAGGIHQCYFGTATGRLFGWPIGELPCYAGGGRALNIKS